MKKDFLNIALAITTLATLIVLAVFFVKLNNVEANSGKTTSKAEEQTDSSKNPDNLSSLTGKKNESGSGEAVTTTAKADKNTATPTPKVKTEKKKPTETPSPTPSPTPTPIPVDSAYPIDISGIDPEKPIVALSFDDGPSSHTDSILETLGKYGAHATFFMVGENIDMYPERVKKVYDSGCEVANHTINHKDLIKLSKEDIIKEVEGNQQKLNTVLGTEIEFLVRPPYGDVNDTVRAAVNHPMIIWWVDTLDWKSKNADAVLEEVKRSTKDGAIILMHDIYGSTAEAAKKVVPWLKEQGYQICSVSEMFAARGEKLENGKTVNSAISAEKYKEKKKG